MTQTTNADTTATTNEFNAFNYVKSCILKQYAKNLLAKKNVKQFTFEMRNYFQNSYVFAYLNKVGACKFVKLDTKINEEGKQMYLVTIKDFNVETKAKSKQDKEYNVFNKNLLNKYIAEQILCK